MWFVTLVGIAEALAAAVAARTREIGAIRVLGDGGICAAWYWRKRS
jgi:hypothetical protein